MQLTCTHAHAHAHSCMLAYFPVKVRAYSGYSRISDPPPFSDPVSSSADDGRFMAVATHLFKGWVQGSTNAMISVPCDHLRGYVSSTYRSQCAPPGNRTRYSVIPFLAVPATLHLPFILRLFCLNNFFAEKCEICCSSEGLRQHIARWRDGRYHSIVPLPHGHLRPRWILE